MSDVDIDQSNLPNPPQLVQIGIQRDTTPSAPPAPNTPIQCTATSIPPSSTPPNPRPLSTRQLNAIPLILTGKTDEQVAESVGVGRQSIWRWRNHHPAFIAELNRQRQQLHATTVDRYTQLLSRALAIIERSWDRNDLYCEDPRLQPATQLLRSASRTVFRPISASTNPSEILTQLLAQGSPLSPDDSPEDDAPPPPPPPPKKSRH